MGKIKDLYIENKEEQEQLEFAEQEHEFEISIKNKSDYHNMRGDILTSTLKENLFTISPEEDERLTQEKRQTEANDREQDIANGWTPDL